MAQTNITEKLQDNTTTVSYHNSYVFIADYHSVINDNTQHFLMIQYKEKYCFAI